MVKGLRLAFVKQWGVFGRGCWVQELLLKLGIYTNAKNQINTATLDKETKRLKRTRTKHNQRPAKQKAQREGGQLLRFPGETASRS